MAATAPGHRVDCAVMTDAIPYSIRRSPRARRVSVTVDASTGVEVVLPRRAPERQIVDSGQRLDQLLLKPLRAESEGASWWDRCLSVVHKGTDLRRATSADRWDTSM